LDRDGKRTGPGVSQVKEKEAVVVAVAAQPESVEKRLELVVSFLSVLLAAGPGYCAGS